MYGDRVARSLIERSSLVILRVKRFVLSFCYSKRKSVDGCRYHREAICTLGTKRCTLVLYSIISIFYIIFFTVLRFLYSFYYNLITYLVRKMCVCMNECKNAKTKRWRYAHAPVSVSPEEWRYYFKKRCGEAS